MCGGREQLEEALQTLGALLEHRGVAAELITVGGASLLLQDLVDFKLYAAVDHGPDSKHAQHLLLLNPDPEELTAAARWCQTHDPSDAFADQLRQALAFLRTRLGHA